MHYEISDEQKDELKLIPMIASFDSTFIKKLLEMLYADNLGLLHFRSVTGRKNKTKKTTDIESNTEKAIRPITPRKMQVIVDEFENRLDKADIDVTEQIRRLQRRNTLIKDAIHNIRKCNEPSDDSNPTIEVLGTYETVYLAENETNEDDK